MQPSLDDQEIQDYLKQVIKGSQKITKTNC
jgi:hypothetical protein